jgi:triacylglycerol lipase
MSPRHLVDKDLLAALPFFPPLDLSAQTLPQLREVRRKMAAALRVPPDLELRVETRHIPGAAGAPPVPIVVYRPPGAAGGRGRPALLHLHGGGFVMGLAETQGLVHRRLCLALDCVVVSVNYRLAPEHPYPAALDDAYAALHWLATEAAALGVDPARIAVGGESAGGGLAACLALRARDRGEIALCHQHLIYPMLDDRTGSAGPQAGPHPYTGHFVWTAADNRYGWRAYLGAEPGGAQVPPLAAAARAADLSGLPPTFIAVGALDLFLEENLEYARRLWRGGIATELHVYPGAFHSFSLVREAGVSQQAAADSDAALRRAFQD